MQCIEGGGEGGGQRTEIVGSGVESGVGGKEKAGTVGSTRKKWGQELGNTWFNA